MVRVDVPAPPIGIACFNHTGDHRRGPGSSPYPVDMTVELEGLDAPVTVTFIEWKKKKIKGTQRIYLCDANGAALLDVAADLRSRGHHLHGVHLLGQPHISWDFWLVGNNDDDYVSAN